MNAKDFDVDTTPRGDLPSRYDEWPIGHPDTGVFNRLNDGKPDHVVLDVRVNRAGYVVIEELPIRDEDVGGLEGRFGDWTPNDVDSGPMASYEPDMRDQLKNNPVGAEGAGFDYEVYGRTIAESDFPNGAPTDPDLSFDEVISWAQARGDRHFSSIIDRVKQEQ